MKILLFQPPWVLIHGKFDELAELQGFMPPLGLGYLAAIAKRLGHEVMILDAEAEKIGLDEQVRKAVEFEPELIGITSTTPCFDKAVMFARAVKEKMSGVKIVIGGAHITVLKEEAFEDCFDAGFISEAEETFEEYLKKDCKRLDTINGMIYRDGKRTVRINELRPLIHDIDKIDFPARELFNNKLYAVTIPKKGLVNHTTMMAIRGCPFQCVFCSTHTVFGRRFRVRTAENVVDEMVHVVRTLGIRHFVFVDSTLTVNRKLTVGICEEIIRRRLRVTWEGWTRANLIDYELLMLMKRSGFIRISFGIESGDPRILKIIKKEVKLNEIRRAYKLVKKAGIEATCSVMIGHPGETKKSIWRTIKFVRSIPEIKYSPLSIATPYPGTELLDMALHGQFGLRMLTQDFTKFTRYGDAVLEMNDLKREDLIRLQKIGMLYIHLTPGRIWYHMTRVNPLHLFREFRAFVRAIF